MGISDAFGFLKILTESIKLLPKNGRFMASIIFLSLLIPSILLILFSYFYRSLTDSMKSPDLSYLQITMFPALVLIAIFLFTVFMKISHVSGIATILVSSMSYSDKKASSQDLISRIRATWRRNLAKNIGTGSVSYMLIFSLVIFIRINPIGMAISIVCGILSFVIQLYTSVVLELSDVVSIVEDASTGAVERAGQLVEGQRHHGFMFNLFMNLVFMIGLWGGWIGLDDMGIVSYGLIILISFSLWRIFWCVGYTVFYFQCMKQLGDIASFEHAKLPAHTQLDTHIP